ncbi:chloride channel [Phakopsora pachyrhizi]|nr:chloride channel [Phakopsora pachyrhizi]
MVNSQQSPDIKPIIRIEPTSETICSDRTTIDWTRERRRELKYQRSIKNLGNSTSQILLDLSQTWLVIIVIGSSIGIVAGILNVTVDWLSDLRLGVCRYGFYLSQRSCCSGLEANEVCYEWVDWSTVLNISSPPLMAFTRYLIFILVSVGFAGSAAVLVKSLAPPAFHTGIPEIKVILSGYVFENYLSGSVLVIKAVGLALAVGSGLSLGKEGPLVHVACCAASLITRPFKALRANETRKREIFSAAAAAGVSVAFGAPLGGVLFVLEELSLSSLPQSTLWRSFACAVVATVTLQYFDPYRSGKLVLFQVQSVKLVWRSFELVPWVLLGFCGGVFGACFTRANIEYAKIRRSSSLARHPIREVLAVTGFTALSSYLLFFCRFFRVPTSKLIQALFQDCNDVTNDTFLLCDSNQVFNTVLSLLITAIARSLMTAITFGVGVPSGIFLPTIGIGACFGRSVGILMNSWQSKYPGLWWFRSSCPVEGSCISPQAYAVIGAASAVGGLTRMTISLVVVIFELTGAVELVLQIMLAVMISKFTADYFSSDGIYEAWINFRGYPYLSPKDEYKKQGDRLVSEIMNKKLICLNASERYDVEGLLKFVDKHQLKGFPIVNNLKENILLGYTFRNELKFALDDTHSNENIEDNEDEANAICIDLSEYVDEAPLSLDPDTSVETVLQYFQKLGLSNLIFTSNNGRLKGILTINVSEFTKISYILIYIKNNGTTFLIKLIVYKQNKIKLS